MAFSATQSGGEASTFICTECGDGFSQYSNILAHMTLHGPLESFSFDGSSNGFEIPREYVLQENGTLIIVNGLAQLPSHLPSSNRPNHYRCEICNRSFSSSQSLQRHQQYGNSERGFRCTLCCKIFEDKQSIKKHLQGHLNEKCSLCGLCGKRFLKVDALNAHQKENHSIPKAAGKLETKEDKKAYPCNKCKLVFFWMSDLQIHSLYHCKGQEPDNGSRKITRDDCDEKNKQPTFTPYRCGLCGDRFESLSTLKEHHVTHQTQEEIDKMNQEHQKPFKRVLPPNRSRRRSNPNGKLHPCKHCHRVFNHSSSLSRHMRYHKGTMHTCVFCGRHFPQRCDLRRHVVMYHKTEGLKLLHTNTQNGPSSNSVDEEKQIKAPEDNSKESSEKELTSGEQTGKGGRVNYKCLECGKKFGLLCVYQRHLHTVTHTGLQPFQCMNCDQRFSSKTRWLNHEPFHDGVVRYTTEGPAYPSFPSTPSCSTIIVLNPGIVFLPAQYTDPASNGKSGMVHYRWPGRYPILGLPGESHAC
uniref:C2H2-type domain-containing protein n=1 Tax=Cyprinodon variegatus TaxID=28743 RepID=A0A3Q2GEU4_CYPVA